MLHSRFSALVALSACAGLLIPAVAQGQGLGLKLQRSIQGPPKGANVELPVFISGERMEGIAGQEMRASGDAELRKGTTSISAERLKYATETEEIEALGSVRLIRDGDVITGPALRYKLDQAQGVFDKPTYVLAPRVKAGALPTEGHGAANQIELLGDENYRMTDGTFSTCKPGNEDWYIKFGQLDMDYGRSLGAAESARVVFMGVPILAAPWLEFSLNNQRKSGFLSPIYGSSGKGGAEVSLPYYVNIAPNRDATITPRVMAKRGLQIGTEFRYLESKYRGEVRYDILPDDKAANRTRYSFSAQHMFADYGFSAGWNLNKVSDDNYFRELGALVAVTSQTHLTRDAYVGRGGSWLGDGTWGVSGRVQRYQTLQDPLALVAEPYARLPQISFNASKQAAGATDFSLTGEYVDFAHPTQVIGKRMSAYPSLSLPLMTSGAYLTPKIGYNWARYALDRNTVGLDNTITRGLPIFSLDSGLTFDRPTNFRGQDVMQTLEPRLYYVNIPTRNQNNIPIFDTGIADLNYAQIFSENSFSGNDRINDANQLTAAVTSRMLQANGQELARATVAQRYYFKDQEVTLKPSDTPRTSRTSDWLAAVSGKITPRWTADSAVQYSSSRSRLERITIGTRYQPEVQKVINLGYRFNHDILRQIDVSGQWPLGGGWYGVARSNYSIQDKKIVEGLAGFEYNGGCWIVRVVGQRFATAVGAANTSIFVQLELNGLASIGSNPLETLKRNISGYSQLNAPISTSSPTLNDAVRPMGY